MNKVHALPLLIFFLVSVVLPGDARLHSEEVDGHQNPSIPPDHSRYLIPHRLNSQNSLASDWFDVKYYKLALRIATTTGILTGSVRIEGICTQNHPPFLSLDLMNSMHIDSVKVGGKDGSFTQQPAAFTVVLDSAYHAGDDLTVDVYYQGLPVPTGFGSFEINSHSGIPWFWSLSEPYGARDWWPCKDTPLDKADSVDIMVTCDSSFTVGSNGMLIAVEHHSDGTATTHWKERYPIATYLVSVAVTNYAQFSNWFRYAPTDSLEILNYVLPESLASACLKLPLAVEGLQIFSNLFGLYPFVREKYGHAQFNSGAMEHQTMTSITSFDEETIIHELAHQWFGDMITCASWTHLWLNEGFATYCTALYLETEYGVDRYRSFMRSQLDRAKTAGGPVYNRDTSNVHDLFSNARVYAKGASVLHMLRHVLGDSVFFRAMYSYANDSSVRFGNAVTDDFRRACENVSGKDLHYFFNEWIYGEMYPSYDYSWRMVDISGTRFVRLTVRQSTASSNPSLFRMPVDVRLLGRDWDSTVTVLDSVHVQVLTFEVPTVIDSVALDPDGWILKTALDETAFLQPADFSLLQNYPNPFNLSTGIRYELPRRARIRLRIFDILGRAVVTLVDGTRSVGSYNERWNADNLPSGVYLYELEAVDVNSLYPLFRSVKKMILLK